MAQAAHGDTVKVHYRGTLEDGSQFDASQGRDPVEITIGGGKFIPRIEEALVGMAAGDTKSVTVPADEAFGARNDELVHEVARNRLPEELDPEVGGTVVASTDGGEQLQLKVVAVTESSVTLDANHPLAGEDLTFELELVEIV